jgi:hypothetical protein
MELDELLGKIRSHYLSRWTNQINNIDLSKGLVTEPAYRNPAGDYARHGMLINHPDWIC